MSPRTGRPKSDNPKTYNIRIRLDANTFDKLQKHCEEKQITLSDFVRGEIVKALNKE